MDNLKEEAMTEEQQRLLTTIREAVIGEKNTIQTAIGEKPLVYADYTATGRSLCFIEDYIRAEVLPFIANTHSETTYTAARTTALRESARDQIRTAVNAAETDHVIFCGSGATVAINKLVDMLGLRDGSWRTRHNAVDSDELPVVFIGPYEHHSNELPWRECEAEVVVIPLDADGLLDLEVLASKLEEYQHRPLRMSSFSAASNVTGLLTRVDEVMVLLHRYDVLAFWDYAAAGPYVDIDMQGRQGHAKDAVFISAHKFIGGPGTPGILIASDRVAANKVPAMPGGGTVVYVSPTSHVYTNTVEAREEGGTPALVESIRAGLVFQLKQTVGTALIEQRDRQFVRRAMARWSDHESIRILGNTDAPRLAIVALQVLFQGQQLHYGFVAALLNDFFGIQARGGCSCAGPYAHHLLGMDQQYSRAIEAQVVCGNSVMRPGWVRLGFNYFYDEATFEYLVRAVELIATHGWRWLDAYRYEDSRWQLASQRAVSNPAALPDIVAWQPKAEAATSTNLAEQLLIAEQQLKCAVFKAECAVKVTHAWKSENDDSRWFVTGADDLSVN